MSVSPLVTNPARPPRKLAKAPRVKNNLKKLPLHPEQVSSKLQFLMFIQKAVSVITFCLVSTTLGMYAWTVFFPKLWSNEYQRLETLQRYERHLTETNESLKNQLAQQAEKPETGLSNPSPTQSIFLNPTSDTKQRPQKQPSAQANQKESSNHLDAISY